MLIDTTGLEYDDRLKKECFTLKELGYSPWIVVLEYANTKKHGITGDGIPYRAIRLISRKILPRGRVLAIKVLEMYVKFIREMLRRHVQVVWLHNIEMTGLIPVAWVLRRLGFVQRIVWDQHELPPEWLLRNRFWQSVLRKLVDACDAIVVANKQRRDFLLENLGEVVREKLHIIENFADQRFAGLPQGVLPTALQDWLKGKLYLLAQGGANPDRHLEELVEAVLRVEDVKLVVVGPYQPQKLDALRLRWGDQLTNHVYFTGLVPQTELVNYIDHALASVVLYAQSSENTRLCAPNRLYQALARGVPVLVGSNPPMASVVQRMGCGEVLPDDGEDVRGLLLGIQNVMANAQVYKERAQAVRGHFIWEEQITTLAAIVDTHLDDGGRT
jgi:glycosyltransferase involved in cell wall biosynthesis